MATSVPVLQTGFLETDAGRVSGALFTAGGVGAAFTALILACLFVTLWLRMRVGAELATIGDIMTRALAPAGLMVLVVGAGAGGIAAGALDAGLEAGRIHVVADAEAALDAVRPRLRDGDSVLVKASRGVRAERVVGGELGAVALGAAPPELSERMQAELEARFERALTLAVRSPSAAADSRDRASSRAAPVAPSPWTTAILRVRPCSVASAAMACAQACGLTPPALLITLMPCAATSFRIAFIVTATKSVA